MSTFLALQPCFDRHERVTAYAIGYRTRLPLDVTDATDTLAAALGGVIDALHSAGLGRVTGGHPGILRVRRESLGDAQLRRLDPHATIVLVEGIDDVLAPATVEAARALVASGYRIAVEQPLVGDIASELAAVAHMIVVDARGLGPVHCAQLLVTARQWGRDVLVRNASPGTPIAGWVLGGASSVQWISHPALAKADVPRPPSVNDATALRLLGSLRDPKVHDGVLEDAFRTDLALSYELLKLVNNAAVAGREVWSIGHAIRLLGRDIIHQRLATIVLRSLGDRGTRAELAHRSLVRGRFCELLADDAGLARARGPLFAVGFLSILPDLLGIPVAKLGDYVPLAPDVRDAIVSRADFFGMILSLVEAYESERWDGVLVRCEAEGIPPEHLADRYLSSVMWAREQLGPQRAQAAA